MHPSSSLQQDLAQLMASTSSKNHYWAYHLLRIRRLLVQTLMVCSFQYLVVVHLPVSSPAFPLYPPIGIAFVFFSLLGRNALPGLFLGGFGGYFLQGLPPAALGLSMAADIGCGCVGAFLCQRVFSCDVKPFANGREGLRFLVLNAFSTCLASSGCRMAALLLAHSHSAMPLPTVVYTSLHYWLADLNAILILSGFLLSWVNVPFSREKLSHHPIEKYQWILLATVTVLSVFFMQQYAFIYGLLGMMAGCLYLSHRYGRLVATGLLFIFSSLYLGYFIRFKSQLLASFGLGLYSLAPAVLLCFTLCVLCLGHWRQRPII